MPHSNVDRLPLVSVEAAGICIYIGNCDILLAAVYKSPWHNLSDTDITKLLSFRNKCILAGALNAEHPFWNTTVPNPPGQKLLQLFDVNYNILLSNSLFPCGKWRCTEYSGS
jgi:hypothetical protein